MNRLKLLTFQVLSIISVLLVASCSSSNGNELQTSEEGSNETLLSQAIGTWMCTKSTDVQGTNTYNNLMIGKEITIYPNRTFSSTAETIGYSGSFTINGNKITAKNNNGDTFLINVSFSGDKMYWEGTSSQGISFNYTFEREGEDNGDNIPENQTSEESSITQEEFLSAYQTCYDECYNFATSQQALEKIRIGGDPDNSINASSVIISETWSAAYNCINLTTTLISKANDVNGISTTEMNRMLAELHGLRAFVYYNIAMLWGNVPLYKEPLSIDDRVIPSKQADVFQFAYEEILKSIPELGSSYNKIAMSKDAALMLATEIALTQKNSNAKDFAEKITWSEYMGEITSSSNEEKPVIWALRSVDGKKTTLLYTYNHILLYEHEWMANLAKAAAGWEEASFTDYGYWAALKRLGYAQTVTGCQDYQLLMPIPISIILMNPAIVQNPGY